MARWEHVQESYISSAVPLSLYGFYCYRYDVGIVAFLPRVASMVSYKSTSYSQTSVFFSLSFRHMVIHDSHGLRIHTFTMVKSKVPLSVSIAWQQTTVFNKTHVGIGS